NDLFGELTIERNGLSLNLARLRTLIHTLSRRVSHLEQSNIRLRTAYDSVATQSSALPKGLQSDPLKPQPASAFSPLPSAFLGHDLSSSFDALEMDR
ncbi:MAG TPA: hypothetical protein DCL61_21465, partial [Cyanobacteria bacterium UBA12227]|nr:hypothetical protein [Cyanobacteria bacterium UBA12227]